MHPSYLKEVLKLKRNNLMNSVFNYINLCKSTPLSFRHAYVTRTRRCRHLWRHKIMREHDSHLFSAKIEKGLVMYIKRYLYLPKITILFPVMHMKQD